jgi:hypothetical protein
MSGVTMREPSVDPAIVAPICAALHRYAGWLDRQHSSTAVRADLNALTTAMNCDTDADAGPLLLALDNSLARLPSGAVRNLLRSTAKQLRSAIHVQ